MHITLGFQAMVRREKGSFSDSFLTPDVLQGLRFGAKFDGLTDPDVVNLRQQCGHVVEPHVL